MTLVLIGIVGGLITGISPCVLPVLPVILLGGGSGGSEASTSRSRPYLIVAGLVVSFALFTLFGSVVLISLHLPQDLIRWVGLALLVLVGLGLLVPSFGHALERPFARFPQHALDLDRNGLMLGVALGAVFVPCAGPVLATITVAGATSQIGWRTIGLTLGFAVGTAIPLLAFALAGQRIGTRLAAFRRHQRLFRTITGVAVVALAIALTFNLSDVLQRDVPNYTQSVSNKLGSALATGGSGSLATCQQNADGGGSATLENCGTAPELTGIQQWLNTPDGRPLSISGLRGKVVLIDFWAYSCINCQRELPHVEAWAKDYASDGFEVVGVHTPEYAFEHVPANVAAGAKRLGLTFPIALDNDYDTWNAYGNDSWPASYLIDATGQIRYVSVGEGDYSGEESLIRQLLTIAHPTLTLPAATDLPDTTPQNANQSPETYLGNDRQQYYAGSDSYASGTRTFTEPSSLPFPSFGLAGTWTVASQSLTAGAGASITLSYDASRVYLDTGGTGTLTVGSKVIHVSGAPDIYTVASNTTAQNGLVTIHLSPGLQAYSFTFG